MPRLSPRLLPILVLAGVALAAGLGRAGALAQEPEIERFHPVFAATQEGWVETQVELREGDSMTVTAFGRASWDGGRHAAGPEGVTIEWCAPISVVHPVGALLVRAGDNPAEPANGATIAGPGRVMLAYNDCEGQYFDNAGTFNITFTVTRAPQAAPAPAQAETSAVAKPAPAKKESGGGGFPLLPFVLFLLLVGGGAGGGFFVFRAIAARRPRFDPSARLESSAWLAPVRLRELQGERMPKRFLTVGGPDADVDFGVPGVWARLIPTEDGGTRLEAAGEVKIFVDGMPLIIGQRLRSGHRVKVGVREFVFLEERTKFGPPRKDAPPELDKPDPRVAVA